MEEFNEFVIKTNEAEELKIKIKAKIKEDSRVISANIFDTIVIIKTKHHTAHYEPIDTGIVVVQRKRSFSEALLDAESKEEYNSLERKLKEEAEWLEKYVKELFDVKIEED
jgi:peptidyl-tRNA hydrolase